MTDIFFIYGIPVKPSYWPVGIACIAEYIESKGFTYAVGDINLHDEAEILAKIAHYQPRYVGLSTLSFEVENNYRLLEKIRTHFPDICIILGGPHAIAAGSRIFAECSAIDIVIQGEGEEAVYQLLSGNDPAKIKGVMLPDGTCTPNEFLCVEDYPSPTYRNFELDRYPRIMTLASSRGCVYQCAFCGARKFLGAKWRAYSAERMIEEFSYWYGRGYRQFYFSDSLFALNKQRILQFCEYVTSNNFPDVSFISDGIRADNIDENLLSAMKKANFDNITVGVESIHDKSLSFLRKGETFATIDKAIRLLDRFSISTRIFLLAGIPGESYADMLASIKYPLRYKYISNFHIGRITPILGTAYYEYCAENGMLASDGKIYPSVDDFMNYATPTKWVSSAEFSKLKNKIDFYSLLYANRSLLVEKKLFSKLPKFILNFISIPSVFDTIKTVSRLVKKVWKKALSLRFVYYKIFCFVVLSKSRSVFTHLTAEEKYSLYSSVQPNSLCVEIGSYLGASSVCIASSPNCSKLYCVDTWNNDAMSEGNRDTYSLFLSNTKALSHKIFPIRGLSANAGLKFKEKIDFLFIDGDHSYEGAKADVESWLPLLRSGGVLVMHDCGWAEGVQRVIQENVLHACSTWKFLPNMFIAKIK